MSNITGNFAADGSSADIKTSKFTILLGHTTDTDNNFGGGTVTLYVSHDGVNFTADSTYTAEDVITSVEYVSGVVMRLTLAGSTSPDLDYSISYV